jgi:hypothetical protein
VQAARRAQASRCGGESYRWPAIVAVVVGLLSLLLVLVHPTAAAILAVLALATGLIGARTAHGPARRVYRWASAVGAFTAVLLVVLLLTWFTSDMTPGSGAESGYGGS